MVKKQKKNSLMDNFNKNLIIVDKNDRIIGVKKAINAHYKKSLTLHRAFSLFLFNSCGNLLLQKRSSSKLVFPSKMTNTCCSHPFMNDLSFTDPIFDVKNHILQRLKYELGIDTVLHEDLKYITRVYYKATGKEFEGTILNGHPEKQEFKEFEFDTKLVEANSYNDFGEWEVDYIFICIKDVTVKPNKDEVSDYRYVDEKEFQDVLNSKDVSPWMAVICKYINIFKEANSFLN